MHAVVIQVGLVAPLLLLLIVYTATRPDASALHRWMAGLLTAILGYVVGVAIRFSTADPTLWILGQRLGELSVCVLTPCFVMTLACYARVPWLEDNRPAVWAMAAPFALFFVLFATNPTHQMMFAHIELGVGELNPQHSAGPLFWVFQIWTYAFILAGAFVVARMLRSPADRAKALLLLCATAVPMVAHTLYLTDALPIDYPLTPATLGVTALLLVAGIRRYQLLGERRVVRRDVFDHLSDGLVLADAEGVVFDLSPAAAAMLGVEDTAVLGSSLRDVLCSLESRNPEDIDALLAPQITAEPKVRELALANGRFIEVSAGNVGVRGEESAARFLVMRDRTNQRQSETLLRQRQKLESLGILAAGVAHEVNNPLAFVRANLVHLQELGTTLQTHLKSDDTPEVLELSEIPEIVDESLVGLDRIGRIVEGLLRLSRPPSEGPSSTDPNDVVTEAVRYAALHRDTGVELEMKLADDLPRVQASGDRLIQVILNLLLNAKQALAEHRGGHVSVETGVSAGGQSVEIRVRDDGPGISEDIQERIFDPFFTTRGPGEGTGLGLSIAYDIVREQGGLLDVTSVPGDGACFAIRLPVHGPAALAEADGADETQRPPGHQR